MLSEPQPARLEGEEALGPGAEQQGVIIALIALGNADRKAVDGPEPRPDESV
jgi:hypothetical protein